MAISKEEVRHIAELARLELSEEEISRFQKELSSILDYFSKLREVDTKGIEPTYQTTKLENVFREDRVEEKGGLTQEEVLSNAPEKKDGYIKVKPVF